LGATTSIRQRKVSKYKEEINYHSGCVEQHGKKAEGKNMIIEYEVLVLVEKLEIRRQERSSKG
jgi:hypothetical protein